MKIMIDGRIVQKGDEIMYKYDTEREATIVEVKDNETLLIKDNWDEDVFEFPVQRCWLMPDQKTIEEKAKRNKKIKSNPSVQLENGVATIGDEIAFKCDVENYGKLKEIKNVNNSYILVLESEHGFKGEYIHGDTTTEMEAERCSVVK